MAIAVAPIAMVMVVVPEAQGAPYGADAGADGTADDGSNWSCHPAAPMRALFSASHEALCLRG